MITEQEQQKIMEMVLLNPFDRLMNYEVVTMEPGHLVMKTIAQREIVENSYQSTHAWLIPIWEQPVLHTANQSRPWDFVFRIFVLPFWIRR